MIFRNKNGMHFVGIGGVGMSGIAEILINMGFSVSGSDMNESDNTKRLASLGAKIFKGHFESNIQEGISVLVTSSAINFDNPEIMGAKKKNIPIIHRSEMLAELVRMKHGIGVAGTHGKTTTSSMLSSVLWSCGLNPTSIVGGKVLNFGSNARSGEGDYLVFEADESDGSFLKLLPAISVVTNIDSDHLDHYKYFDGLKDAFLRYINNIPFYGYSVLCVDDSILPHLFVGEMKKFGLKEFGLDHYGEERLIESLITTDKPQYLIIRDGLLNVGNTNRLFSQLVTIQALQTAGYKIINVETLSTREDSFKIRAFITEEIKSSYQV